MARMLAVFRDRNVLAEVAPTVIAELEARMASMPPIRASQRSGADGTSGTVVATATQERLRVSADASGMPTSINDLNRRFRITSLRAMHGMWRMGRSTYKLFTSDEPALADMRRSILSTEGPRVALQAAAVGVRGVVTVVSELLSGRATANATANLAAQFGVSAVRDPRVLAVASAYPSQFRWELPSQRRAEETYYRNPLDATAVAAAGESSLLARYAAFVQAGKENRFWYKVFGAEQTAFTARLAANVAGTKHVVRDWDAYGRAHIPEARERTVRLEALSAYARAVSTAVRDKYVVLPSALAANASSAPMNGTVAVAATTCGAPWQELCDNCLVIGNYVGVLVGSVEAWADFYTCNAPWYGSDACDLVAEYHTMRAYLVDDTLPVIFGDSPANPARFPPLNRSILPYFDDTAPNKMYFNDIVDLVDDTIGFFLNLFTSFDYLHGGPGGGNFTNLTAIAASVPVGYPVTLVRTNANGERVLENRTLYAGRDDALMAQLGMRPRIAGASAALNPLGLLRASAIRITDVFMLRATIASYAESRMAVRAATVNPLNTLFDVAAAWFNWIYQTFYRCDRVADPFGLNPPRFSLFHAAVIMLVPALPAFILLVAAPQSAAVYGVVGFVLVNLYLIGTLSLASGSSISCFPAIAPVVWSIQAPTLLFNTLFPKQWFLGSGLIQQYDYDNSNCMNATLWATHHFTAGNCAAEWQWTNLFDFVVFPLRQWAPAFLAHWSDPANYVSPLDMIVGAAIVQETLHRWDDVNMTTDAVIYSANWTCWVIMGVASLMILYFLLTLLRFAPVSTSLALISAVLVLFVKIAAFFIVGLVAVYYYLLTAPLLIEQRATQLLQKRGRIQRALKTLAF